MSNTPNFNTFTDNSQLEADMKPLCKEYVIRFAKEVLGWTEPVKFRWATLEENKNGVDCFISRDGKSVVGIDLKIRREGTTKYWYQGPDIAIEYEQHSTYGWAGDNDHNPKTVILFIFLDNIKPNSKFSNYAAIALTLGTCKALVAEKDTAGFRVKKAYNSPTTFASNIIVPLSSIESRKVACLKAI
jgi:hypothetical protein